MSRGVKDQSEYLQGVIDQLQELHTDMERISSQTGLRKSAPVIYFTNKDTYKYDGQHILRRTGSDPHDRTDPPWEPIIRCNSIQLIEMFRQLSDIE